MHISRIEIQNIKSHSSSAYDLAPGTTAITGPNGAGKSTIVEAIAWVLFDLIEYKKEDFVRRGEKKGSVTVTFESGLDEREYVVFRDTGTAYHVTDPRLGVRIADKKEEVYRFLWQHLGLEPGTDLRSLFRQAIGVPQGTLTAIFLESATDRKVAFDRLLKVEEYRQAAERLRETSRFVDQSVANARESIARAEGELSRFDAVEEELKIYSLQVKDLQTEIESNQADQTSMRDRIAILDEAQKKVESLQIKRDEARSIAERSGSVIVRLRQEVSQAEDATSKIEVSRAAAGRHLEVLAKLAELERERAERDKLRAEISKVESAILSVEAENKRLTFELASIQTAHEEIKGITPDISRQEALEKELGELREKAAAARVAMENAAAIDARLIKLRENFREYSEKVQKAEVEKIKAGELGELEKRNDDLIRHLAQMRAALDRDEKFQSEIKGGLCPVLSQKCLNLRDGQTLDGFLTSQFSQARSHIAELETERDVVRTALTFARAAETQLAASEEYRRRMTEISDEGQRLKEEKAAFEELSAAGPEIEEAITSVGKRLKALDDPRARLRVAKTQVEREPLIRVGISEAESNLERLTAERNILIEQIDPYLALDENWKALSAERDSTLDAHRTFLANQAVAETLADRRAELGSLEAEHGRSANELAEAEKLLADAEAKYDKVQHAADRDSLRKLENAFHSALARIELARNREKKLTAEIHRFADVKKALQEDYREKERLESVAEATAFIRDTLKEAAPRVARNYVYHVSLEANQLFREISGNAERTLKWAEDYSVSLEENGYERPFISLSGGEQMAAALAIRLGLLKQLTDIRIAFFDEPTANMDAERRDNLGQQISRITHFDQLIVISHDDTFDSYVDNVISLG